MMQYSCSDLVHPLSLSQAVAHLENHLTPGHIGQIHSLDDQAIPAVFIAYAVSADGDISLDDAITDQCPKADAATWRRVLAHWRR